MDNHKFWKTQPVSNTITTDINKLTTLTASMYKQYETPLPENFSWCRLDINNLDEVYKFINTNYFDNMSIYKCFYSKNTLKMLFETPSTKIYNNTHFIGLRYHDKLIGTILIIPLTLSLFNTTIKTIETTLLCIDKNVRNINISPLLIQEVCRTTYNIRADIDSCFYMTGLNLPHKLVTMNYYHRPINVNKLIQVKFMVGDNNDYTLPEKPKYKYRKITKDDIKLCTEKYNAYYKQYNVHQVFTPEEFEYKFMSCDGVIDSFINSTNTDFISISYSHLITFDNISFSVGHIYHYFNSNNMSLTDLIQDALIMIKDKVDVVNCLDSMNNKLFINKLHFLQGTGQTNFYLWNRTCPALTTNDIALYSI